MTLGYLKLNAVFVEEFTRYAIMPFEYLLQNLAGSFAKGTMNKWVIWASNSNWKRRSSERKVVHAYELN